MKERPNEAAATAHFEFDALREANNYRHALVREFSETLHGRVIEIGSGIGQITELLRALPQVQYLQSIEPDLGFCEAFRKNLPTQPLLQGTIEDVEKGTHWNAILSINVLEHIREDEAELRRYRELLRRDKGTINLFVPARQEIYAPIDEDFGHHRRYSKFQLQRKLQAAGFEIVRLRYFNWVGYFAWWLTFCVLQKRGFNVASVRFFDRMIFPCVYAMETKIAAPPFGQSLLAVARAI
jgi:SAM-dependent methyltransferase